MARGFPTFSRCTLRFLGRRSFNILKVWHGFVVVTKHVKVLKFEIAYMTVQACTACLCLSLSKPTCLWDEAWAGALCTCTNRSSDPLPCIDIFLCQCICGLFIFIVWQRQVCRSYETSAWHQNTTSAVRSTNSLRTKEQHFACTLWFFNIAMENGPFIDGLPIKNGDFPWQTVSHNQMVLWMGSAINQTGSERELSANRHGRIRKLQRWGGGFTFKHDSRCKPCPYIQSMGKGEEKVDFYLL